MRWDAWGLCLSLALILGCEKGTPPAPPPVAAEAKKVGEVVKGVDEAVKGVDQAAKVVAAKVDQAVKVATDDRAALTPEQYEALMLGLAKCSIKNDQIDYECPERKAWQEARTRTNLLKDLAGMSSTLGKKHIKHASPAVRIQAASFLGSIFGADKSGQEVLLQAATTEKDSSVLIAIQDTLFSKGKANPEVGQFLLAMADHPATSVRKKAMISIGSGWNRDMAGAVEKLIERINKDPEMEVREYACKYSGNHGDDRLVPVYGRHTKDPSKEPKMYRACMEGLILSWANYPLYETSNEKAYRLTLKRLKATPRSNDVPPWALLGNFKYLGKEDIRSLQTWRPKATWFKVAELNAALETIVTDPQANSLGRKGALDSMIGLGTDKATLQRMRAKYEGSKEFGDKSIIESLDKAIAGAK